MESPENNCVQCHMPRSPTEIAHLAFTHHRIGIHANPPADSTEASPPPSQSGVLRPFHDLSRLGDLERRRSLGIAYAETAGRQKDPALAAAYNDRAGELLWPLAGLGMHDPNFEYFLFMLSSRRNPGRAARHLEKALADPGLPIHPRCDGLHALAQMRAAEGRFDEAVGLARQVIRLRRDHDDWLLLAELERARGNQPAAAEALEAAVHINTRLPAVHRALAAFYARQGDNGRAEWHRQRAVTVGQ
jgi:tetratricopeptide (TPR) repeat protein